MLHVDLVRKVNIDIQGYAISEGCQILNQPAIEGLGGCGIAVPYWYIYYLGSILGQFWVEFRVDILVESRIRNIKIGQVVRMLVT